MPALIVATQALGEPRYPSLKGIMGITDRVVTTSTATPIEDARVIVAGGRGIGSLDGFRVVEELAQAGWIEPIDRRRNAVYRAKVVVEQVDVATSDLKR